MDSTGNNFLNGYPVFRPEIDNFNHVTCTYADIDLFCNFNVNSFFNILMFNIRSLRKNFAQFLAYYSYMFVHFSFILLTEIWLDNDSADTFVLPGFHKFDLCRNNYGGGVRLFVRDGISASVLSDFTLINDFIEILTVKCLVSGVEFIVSLIYHSPTASHVTNNMFVEYFLSLLSQLKTKHLPIIVGGDLNLNLLNPYNLANVHLFINGMFELNLIPAINIPTKVNVEKSSYKVQYNRPVLGFKYN